MPARLEMRMSPMCMGAGTVVFLICSMQAVIFSLGMGEAVLTLVTGEQPPVTRMVVVRVRVGWVHSWWA